MNTPLSVVSLYVGLNLLFLMVISFNVGKGRMKYKINLGDDGNDDMQRRIRAQGNYIEYAPLAIIGLVLLALVQAPLMLLHILGAGFFIVRIFHFLELGLNKMSNGRMIGTLGTMITLLVTAVSLIIYGIF